VRDSRILSLPYLPFRFCPRWISKTLYKAYKSYCIEVEENGQSREVEVSKLYDVADFKYTKVRVERPLRLSYEITTEKIDALKAHSKFKELATSK
jgi:type I restriction enzyme M protein